jgi:hypothetical protein
MSSRFLIFFHNFFCITRRIKRYPNRLRLEMYGTSKTYNTVGTSNYYLFLMLVLPRKERMTAP